MNLAELQGKCKKESDSYHDEFLQQYNRFLALHKLLVADPSSENTEYHNLISFHAQLSSTYSELKTYPSLIIDCLRNHAARLSSDTRFAMINSLVLMRSRGSVSLREALPLFFDMLSVNDKKCRQLAHSHIVSQIRGLNHRKSSDSKSMKRGVITNIGGDRNAVNRELQTLIYKRLGKHSPFAVAKRAFNVVVELYARGIWRDDRTINAIAEAIYHDEPEMRRRALIFFVEEDKVASSGRSLLLHFRTGKLMGGADKDDNNRYMRREDIKARMDELREVVLAAEKQFGRNRKQRMRAGEQARRELERLHAADEGLEALEAQGGRSALEMINDPERLVDTVFKRLRGQRLTWRDRIVAIDFIARCIGRHHLVYLDFYDYLLGLIQKQRTQVTLVLAATATATHDMIPPETLLPLIVKIANEFIQDSSTAAQITVGLSSIRAIVARCPSAMNDREDLVKDLVEYAHYKRDKGVVAAARSLMHVFREHNPHLLAQKDRGKEAAIQMAAGQRTGTEFGTAAEASDRLFGAVLLEKRARGEISDDEASDTEDSDVIVLSSVEGELDWDAIDAGEGEEKIDPVKAEKQRRKEVAKLRKLGRGRAKLAAEAQLAAEKAEAWDFEEYDVGSDYEADTSSTEEEAEDDTPMEQVRLLTDDEFAAMERLQKKVSGDYQSKMGHVKATVNPSDLLSFIRSQKQTRDERYAHAAAGRAEHQRSSRYGKKTGGSTNIEKRKTKDFQMIIHSEKVRSKAFRSTRERRRVERKQARHSGRTHR